MNDRFGERDLLLRGAMAGIGQDLLEALEEVVEIAALLVVNDRDAHVANSEVGVLDLLVQTRGEHDVLSNHLWQHVGRLESGGVLDGRHAVGTILDAVGDELLEAKTLDEVLDAVRSGNVLLEALLKRRRLRRHRRERLVERIDEVGWWCAKVGARAGLVRLHDGQPLLPGAIVAVGPRLSRLKGLDSLGRSSKDHEAGWASKALLRSGEDNVNAPVLHPDLLGSHAAHAIEDKDRLGADALDELTQTLGIRKDGRRGVDVGEGDDLVLLRLELRLHLGERGLRANGRLELVDLGTVRFEAFGKAVAKVAAVEHKRILAWLNHVGCDVVPTQRATASGDDRLGVGRKEDLSAASRRRCQEA